MPQTLIPPGELIKSSWQTFTGTWETTVRYSSWVLLVGVLNIIPLFLPKTPGMSYLGALLAVIGIGVSIWTSIRVYQVVLALNAKKQVTQETTSTAVTLIWPVILVSILIFLATFGAFILIIIPGIYVGIRLGFGVLLAIDSGKRGTDAVKETWALTKNRFWEIFGRQLAGGITFGLLLVVVMFAGLWLVGKLSGAGGLDAMMMAETPVAQAGSSLVQYLLNAAFMPLLYIFQVKLYKNLQSAK